MTTTEPLTHTIAPVPEAARSLQHHNIRWYIIADRDYGEESSREHATLEPRCLGGDFVIVRCFARIHETNLSKQGILPLTFEDRRDHERIVWLGSGERDMALKGEEEGWWGLRMCVGHSFHGGQIGWLRAGSALNYMREVRGKVL